MSAALKLGLIGAGEWGKKIIRTITGMPDIRLAFIATHTSKTFKDIPGDCEVSNDWRQLTSVDELDGLIIASPAGLHAEMSILALQKKIPVFVEKPFALTVSDAQLVLATVKKHSGILQVNYIDIVNPAWQALLASLPLVGDIRAIKATFGGSGPPRADVTVLWDWGSHPIALITGLLNAPDNIHASQIYKNPKGNGFVEEIDIELQYGHVRAEISIGNNYAKSTRSLCIEGTEGNLIYDDNELEKIVFRNEQDTKGIEYSDTAPLRAALDRFTGSIVRGFPDYDDALLGLQVTNVLSAIDSELAGS